MSIVLHRLNLSLRLAARRSCSSLRPITVVHPAVKDALFQKKPVVALESTIITHGMPYPQNLETALEVEEIVRQEGSVPATIAIINGRIKVGLNAKDLQELASKNSQGVVKCSRRDLPYVIGNCLSGGTTVAGTMIIANMVGIKIFATGGIGGVHRQGEDSMDVSADLIELGRTPVCVVSSGVKSILDIPRTLEYLETQGVCVSTYGSPGGYFPDFYTPNSGCKVPYNVQTPEEAARLIQASVDLGLTSGMLIAVPVPVEYAIDKELVDNAINQALVDAREKNVAGKDVTPFLLSAISKLTEGKSLAANIALIKNNARTASKIATAFYRPLQSRCQQKNTPTVIGGSILDLCLTLLDEFQLNGATYDVKAKQTAGGVGRNLAEGIYKIHGSANFISAVGEDELGKSLLNLIPEELTSRIYRDPHQATSLCSVIFDKHGDCKLVLGNMQIHKSIRPDVIEEHKECLKQSPLIVMDANLPLSTMTAVLKLSRDHKIPVFFEPTDMRIAEKPFSLPSELWSQIKFVSPNIFELVAMVKALKGMDLHVPERIALLPFAKTALEMIRDHFHCILLTLGDLGVIVDRRKSTLMPGDDVEESAERIIHYYPTKKIEKLVNVSGAGDSFSSGFISNMLKGKSEEECVALGFFAAQRALQSEGAVPKEYFKDDLILEIPQWSEI